MQVPVPFFVVTRPDAGTVEGSRPDTPGDAPPTGATASAAKPIDPAEARLIRRAQAAYAAGKIDQTMAALRTYEAQFPGGQLESEARALRASLSDAGVK